MAICPVGDLPRAVFFRLVMTVANGFVFINHTLQLVQVPREVSVETGGGGGGDCEAKGGLRAAKRAFGDRRQVGVGCQTTAEEKTVRRADALSGGPGRRHAEAEQKWPVDHR